MIFFLFCSYFQAASIYYKSEAKKTIRKKWLEPPNLCPPQVFSSIRTAKICLGQIYYVTGRPCFTNFSLINCLETWQHVRWVQALNFVCFCFSNFGSFHLKICLCCHGNRVKSVAMATSALNLYILVKFEKQKHTKFRVWTHLTCCQVSRQLIRG